MKTHNKSILLVSNSYPIFSLDLGNYLPPRLTIAAKRASDFNRYVKEKHFAGVIKLAFWSTCWLV